MNIDDLKAQFRDYARTDLFRIRFDKASTDAHAAGESGALGAFTSTVAGGLLGNVDDAIDFAAKEVSWPAYGIQETNFTWRGYKMPVPSGAPNTGEFNATFICDSDMKVYKFFFDWMNLLVNLESGVGQLVNEFIFDKVMVYQVRQDQSFQSPLSTSYVMTMQNVIPTNLGEINFTSEEGIAEFQVSFQFTKMTFNTAV